MAEWRVLRIAMAVIALVVLADVIAWKVRDVTIDKPTRLELTVRCLRGEKRVPVTVPAGSPIADSASAGSLAATIDGAEVVVALAGSVGEAVKLERYYHSVEGALIGRLERRGLSVYLWDGVATPTQRQTTYDCQYD